MGYPTTSAPRRSDPSKGTIQTSIHVPASGLYTVLCGTAHFPLVRGNPRSGCAGAGLGPCDHVLEINSNTYLFEDD
jgi:hypothetical protein